MAQSRAQKKYAAIQRANRRLQNRLEDIDWEIDVLVPEMDHIAQLEATENVEIEAGNETEDQD